MSFLCRNYEKHALNHFRFPVHKPLETKTKEFSGQIQINKQGHHLLEIGCVVECYKRNVGNDALIEIMLLLYILTTQLI